jgi:hypothetical protein
MYKQLVIVLFLLVIGFSSKSQQFNIKPIQSYIAIERSVITPPTFPPNSTNETFSDNLIFKNTSGVAIGVTFLPNSTNNGVTQYDTVLIAQQVDAPASVRRYSDASWQVVCPGCETDGYGYYWDGYTDYSDVFANEYTPLHYPFQDTTVINLSTLRVKTFPSPDVSYNLPTHDRINLTINAPQGYLNNINWQYSVGTTSNWITILGTTNSLNAYFSAQDIFGADYINHLGETINIKAIYTSAYTNNTATYITPFTVRLSSPHILQITPVNVGCYGESNGAIKIKFDRTLQANEKLNIFLKDTASEADYSALNLTSANFTTTLDSVYTLQWQFVAYWPYYVLVNQLSVIPVPTYQWITELPASSFHASLIGKYNGINTYTGGISHFKYAQLTEPPIQDFYVSVQENVICKGGNTGVARIAAIGGVGNYKYGVRHETDSVFIWKNFTELGLGTFGNSKSDYVRFLKKGRYFFKIRDANNCILRDTTGNEVIKFKDITEPAEELKVELLDVNQITAYDSINGSIRIKLIGGTPRIGEPITLPVYRYLHQWKDSATNTVINNFTLDTLGGKYETKISNLPGGTYYFEATDRYYSPDTNYNYQGCRIFLKVVLKKPDPLLVNIIQQQPVRCKDRTDGVLRAAATGGVIDSLGYSYKWFKMVAGSFVQQASTDSLLSDIGIGQYKVEVKDKNNNFKVSTILTVTEPTLLIANATTTQSSCFSNADGTALGTATGGTMPYRFQWSNSDLTPLMDSVPGGSYFLLVTDSLGCEATKQVSITSPIDMQTNITTLPIKCNSEANGTITVVPSGGTAPYQYTWSTGVTNVNNIQNLATGRYWLRTKDNNNCTKTDTIDVINPVKYGITAGPDRVVCPSQTIPLTATILTDSGVVAPTLTYQWVGPVGFTTSTLKTVNTLKPGTYFLSATNSTGCVQKDTLVVTYNATSAVPEFIVSTQAYVGENVLLANLSNPVPDSVKWIVPAGATILSQSRSFCELKFADTGRFNVAINNYYPSGCVYAKNKNINVTSNNTFNNLGNQANAFLKLFRVYPNPTAGAFTVELVFNGITKARVRMVNTLTNFTVFDEVKEGQYSYTIPYSYPSITATTYIIVIETAKGNFIFKLIKA